MMSKYLYSILLIFGFIVGWNVRLIQRDAKLFKAYDAYTQSTTCPYFK